MCIVCMTVMSKCDCIYWVKQSNKHYINGGTILLGDRRCAILPKGAAKNSTIKKRMFRGIISLFGRMCDLLNADKVFPRQRGSCLHAVPPGHLSYYHRWCVWWFFLLEIHIRWSYICTWGTLRHNQLSTNTGRSLLSYSWSSGVTDGISVRKN